VEDGCDSALDEIGFVFVLMRQAEEGFVLLDGEAFVVQDGASGPDPARGGLHEHELSILKDELTMLISLRRKPWLGLYLSQDLVSRPIEIAIGVLKAGIASAVNFARCGVHHNGEAVGLEALELVLEARRGVFQGVAGGSAFFAQYGRGDDDP
jgi:hypothetical protein